MSTTIRLAIASVVVGALALGIQSLAWRMTGSVTLLADAMESTVNVATAIAALIATKCAFGRG
jgi:divalent metal cation (Fe/Co/Zn/Cd) transporter